MGEKRRPFFLFDLLRLARRRREHHLYRQIDTTRVPRHIAIIMDGNGRWARARGLARSAGHRAGVEALREVVRACRQVGVRVLTVYAFSTENWKRPAAEVAALMDLLVEYLRKELSELQANQVQVRTIGDLSGLPERAQEELLRARRATAANGGLILNIAVNYGGRAEITRAAGRLAAEVQAGRLAPGSITEEVFASHLDTAGLPDPDLVIRASGEMRLSNFLLWQSAYAEFWLSQTLWPDFGRVDLWKALLAYQKRRRRFGGLRGEDS